MDLPVGSEILRLLSEAAPQGNGIARGVSPMDSGLMARIMGGQGGGPALSPGGNAQGGGMGLLSALIASMRQGGRGQGQAPNLSKFVEDFRNRALQRRALIESAKPTTGTIRQ